MPKNVAVNILDDIYEDLESTSEIIGHLDEILCCIEDLAGSDAAISRHRIIRLAALGRFTAEGWRSTIRLMQKSIAEAAGSTESHLVTARAFAGTRAAEQSRDEAHA